MFFVYSALFGVVELKLDGILGDRLRGFNLRDFIPTINRGQQRFQMLTQFCDPIHL
jgi:hypothetical protein